MPGSFRIENRYVGAIASGVNLIVELGLEIADLREGKRKRFVFDLVADAIERDTTRVESPLRTGCTLCVRDHYRE